MSARLIKVADGWVEDGKEMSVGQIVSFKRSGALVLKVPGRHYNGGQGRPRPWVEGQYRVYQIDEHVEQLPGEVYNVRLVTSFPLRARAKMNV